MLESTMMEQILREWLETKMAALDGLREQVDAISKRLAELERHTQNEYRNVDGRLGCLEKSAWAEHWANKTRIADANGDKEC